MGDHDLQYRLFAPVTATQAYDGICRISEWWMIGFEGSARELGDTFSVHSKEMFVDFVVAEAISETRLVWQVVDCNLHWLQNKKEWVGTRIEWDLTAETGGVAITLTHCGLRPGVECYEECVEGWELFAGKSLKQYLSTGTGSPDLEP